MVPRRVAPACGCARAARTVNELWHLKPWKTRHAGGRDRCSASRRSDCPRGFAGSPMTNLDGSPDHRAPSRFPPRALSRGPRRTSGGLCPLLSPWMCRPQPRSSPRSHLGVICTLPHGTRTCGDGMSQCKSLPCWHRWSQGTVPVLAFEGYLPRLGPRCSPHGPQSVFRLSTHDFLQVHKMPHSLPVHRSHSLGHQHHPSSSASQGHPRSSGLGFPPRCQIGTQHQLLQADEESSAAERFGSYFL